MKRGEPLKRTTPLKGGKPLARGTSQLRTTKPLARSTPMPRSAPSPRTAATTRKPATPDPVTPATRAEVAARSGGRCEARVTRACVGVGQHVHHRKLRRHGDHRPVNLLHVCYACHDYIHHHVAWAYEYGYLVKGRHDPAEKLPRAA